MTAFKHTTFLHFVLLISCLWASAAHSADHATTGDDTAVVSATIKELNLSPYFFYTEAKNEEMEPEDLQDRETINWQKVESSSVNLGFQEKAFWLRAKLKTEELNHNHWILEQAYALIDNMKLFVYRNGTLIQQWHVGDTLTFSERPLQHTNFLFPLQLEPHQNYEFYIWAKNTDAMELPLHLFEYNEFIAEDNQRSVIDGIFYGLLIIMAAYNLLLYLNIKDRSYLYYVMYVICMLLYFMSQKGFLFQHILPQSPVMHHYSIPLILVITLHAVSSFFKDFLQLPKNTPRIWLGVKVVMGINILFAPLTFVLPYQISIFLIIGNAAFAALYALGIAIYLSRTGMRTAQMLLAGWTLLIICIVFMTLSKIGIIYNEFMANYGLRFGTSFEILIFSLALSYRINEERRAKEVAIKQVSQERQERIKAQDLALQKEIETRQTKEQALLQQQSLNANLEQLVQERTSRLEDTLKDLEKANHELEMLSSKDGLTGVFNRRTFDNKGREEWHRSRRQQEPLSLLMVDIDHFKRINDTKGHQCGDYVLIELAKLMTTIVSRPADLVTRYGGEEFAILLPNTPPSGAQFLATELVSKAAKMDLIWEGEPFHISISIGVQTLIADDSNDLHNLVATADGALYEAKKGGRNQWVFASAATSGER